MMTLMMPSTAHAASETTTASTTDAYQLYDTRARTQQVTVNKVWNDGVSNDDRKSGSTSYQSMMSVNIMTGVPQSSIRTYSIKFDANGGSFGADSSGNAITSNTLSYNAKNAVTSGTYAVPERTDGYTCIGWSTSATATGADSTVTSAVTSPSLKNSWMNARSDKSVTTLYAVWKDCSVRYAVMMYGMYVDKDASGSNDTVTFGPALGYPEFSRSNDGTEDKNVTPTMTRHHDVNGDTTVMSEDVDACTDSSHSVITGTDAGTDSSGNAYRCLHYDNWNTIIWWCKTDPHVYDKCMKKGCSKTVVISPTAASINSDVLSTNPDDSNTGDGNSYIMDSKWDDVDYDHLSKVNAMQQGYAASLIRAKLVGADSHTNTDEYYAGKDAATRYTSESCVFACFPTNIRRAIVAKDLSGVDTAQYTHDIASNDNVKDKLWLFSPDELVKNEVYSNNYASSLAGFHNWWLRSPYNDHLIMVVDWHGYLWSAAPIYTDSLMSPGFILSAAHINR